MRLLESTFQSWKKSKYSVDEYNLYPDPQDEELSDGDEFMEISFFDKIPRYFCQKLGCILNKIFYF